MAIDLIFGSDENKDLESSIKSIAKLIETDFQLDQGTAELFSRAIYAVLPNGEFPKEAYKFQVWWDSCRDYVRLSPFSQIQNIELCIDLLKKIIQEP